jgi:hypothetical protein
LYRLRNELNERKRLSVGKHFSILAAINFVVYFIGCRLSRIHSLGFIENIAGVGEQRAASLRHVRRAERQGANATTDVTSGLSHCNKAPAPRLQKNVRHLARAGMVVTIIAFRHTQPKN